MKKLLVYEDKNTGKEIEIRYYYGYFKLDRDNKIFISLVIDKNGNRIEINSDDVKGIIHLL